MIIYEMMNNDSMSIHTNTSSRQDSMIGQEVCITMTTVCHMTRGLVEDEV